MKKKIIALLLALMLVFAFVSCNDDTEEDATGNQGDSNVEIDNTGDPSNGIPSGSGIQMPIIPWN